MTFFDRMCTGSCAFVQQARRAPRVARQGVVAHSPRTRTGRSRTPPTGPVLRHTPGPHEQMFADIVRFTKLETASQDGHHFEGMTNSYGDEFDGGYCHTRAAVEHTQLHVEAMPCCGCVCRQLH